MNFTHQAASLTIAGKPVSNREPEKWRNVLSKAQENEALKGPPNRSINRTRKPTPRYPFTHSGPVISSLGGRTLVERKRLIKRCQEFLMWNSAEDDQSSRPYQILSSPKSGFQLCSVSGLAGNQPLQSRLPAQTWPK